ncbi:MAG: type IV pilin protein [Candidatus Korobacteraceae bacterium]
MARESGFSLIELLIVVAIILVISAIALPNFLKSRVAANESAAVTHIRTLSTAQIAYAQTYPTLGYTCSISALGPPAGGAPLDSTAAGIVDTVLASGTKQGYVFSFRGCAGMPRVSYNSTAVPQSSGTGVRAFCSNATGIISYAQDGTAGTCQTSGTVLR